MEHVDKNDSHGLQPRAAATSDDKAQGFHSMLARSQVALSAFARFEEILKRNGRLLRDEQAIVALEVAMSCGCNYCRGVVSREARDCGVSDDSVRAILHGFEPSDPRYRLLLNATRRLMSETGNIGRAEVSLFEERGVSFEELLEIIAIIAAFKLVSYANNLAQNQIDRHGR